MTKPVLFSSKEASKMATTYAFRKFGDDKQSSNSAKEQNNLKMAGNHNDTKYQYQYVKMVTSDSLVFMTIYFLLFIKDTT